MKLGKWVLAALLATDIGFRIGMPAAHAAEIVGVYEGNGHYGKIAIVPRGDGYLLETCLRFNGYCLDASALLIEKGSGRYESHRGQLLVRYNWSGSSFDCYFPVELEIALSTNQLLIEEYGPSQIYTQWPYAHCPRVSALNYSHYIEKVPYVRILTASEGRAARPSSKRDRQAPH
jgi:hypothetical protein